MGSISTLTHQALEHHESCFSVRTNMQSAQPSREDKTYFEDEALIPEALNIRSSQLTPSQMGLIESQESTPRGALRVMNPDPDVDQDFDQDFQQDFNRGYNDHRHNRQASIYIVSFMIPSSIPC
jgi:hypothetical protein